MKNTSKNTPLKDNKTMNMLVECLRADIESMEYGVIKLTQEFIVSTDRYNLDEIIIGSGMSYFDFLVEATQAVNVMKIAELKSFVLVDHSTALMDEIHYFIEAGAKFGEPVEIETVNKWNEKENIKGIRFTL